MEANIMEWLSTFGVWLNTGDGIWCAAFLMLFLAGIFEVCSRMPDYVYQWSGRRLAVIMVLILVMGYFSVHTLVLSDSKSGVIATGDVSVSEPAERY